jgi:hypothetical protein
MPLFSSLSSVKLLSLRRGTLCKPNFSFMNTATTSLFLLTIATALCAGPSWAREHRIDLAGTGLDGRLTITGVNGDIVITGTDDPVVVIQSDDFEDDELEARPTADGMRSLLSGGPDDSGIGLNVKRDGRNITLVPVRPHYEAGYELRIPRSMSVKIAGVLRGDVSLQRIAGEVEIATTEGDIELAGVSGSVVVNAVNGDVEVAFAAVPPTPSSVNSVNGSVTVSVPADAKLNLDMMTINGDIRTDLAVEVREKQSVPWGGPSSVKATLNGGGVTLQLRSINDDIVVHALPKPEKAGAK